MPTIASESFTGADGTELGAHNPLWVKVPGFTDTGQIQSNRVRGPNTRNTSTAYRYNVAPETADYEVSAEFFVADGADTAANAGVLARAASGSQTMYMARYRRGTGFQLFKYVGGPSPTQIGSTVAHTYASGDTGKIRLRVEGSTISVFRGDETTAAISVTDTSITAAGYPGLWTNTNSNTVGPQLDNWSAATLSGAEIVSPAGIASAEAFGAAAFSTNSNITVGPAGIPSGEAFGTATVADGSTVTPDGIWTWFTEPRAVFHNGAYYVGWLNSAGDAGVTKVVSTTGATTHFTLRAAMQVDDHNNAAIHIRPDGRVVCFYGKHSDANGIRYRVSTNPEDISSFASEVVIAPTTLPTSYANPRYLSAAGRLFYHYRAGTPPDAPHSIISTADYSAWTAETKLFVSDGSARPYVKSTTNSVDRIDFFLTNCHPSEGVASVYHCYAQWDAGTSALRYYTSPGVELTLPINPSSLTLIKSGSPNDNWVWDIAYGTDGRPRVLYTRFNGTADHRYEFSRWDGSAWTTPTQVCTGGTYLYSGEPYYSGGMCFDGNNRNVVYVSRQVSGQWEIQEYRTADNGATWALERSITSGSAVKNCRPYSPEGHDGELGVIWWSGTYSTYTSYSTAIKRSSATTVAANLTPQMLDASSSIFAPALALAAFVKPPPLANGSTVYAPALSLGPVTLAPPLLTSDTTAYAPSLSLGSVKLAPPLLTNANVFHAPGLTLGAVALTPPLLTNDSAAYAPSLYQAGGPQVVSPPLLANASMTYGPTLSLGTVSLTPALLTNAGTVHAPVLSMGGVALTPPLLDNLTTFYPPSLSFPASGLAQVLTTPMVYSSGGGTTVAGPTAAEIAQALWDHPLTGSRVPGSSGSMLQDAAARIAAGL